jgi:cytochrome c biogenesis protein CcdA
MIDVTAQPYEALLLFHGGAVAGFIYLLIRIVRNLSKHRFVTHLLDAVFVILLTGILAGYLFLANYGTVRGFLLAAFALGFAACYWLFAPLFARITQKIRKNRFRFGNDSAIL